MTPEQEKAMRGWLEDVTYVQADFRLLFDEIDSLRQQLAEAQRDRDFFRDMASKCGQRQLETEAEARRLRGQVETVQRYLVKWSGNHSVDWAELPLALQALAPASPSPVERSAIVAYNCYKHGFSSRNGADILGHMQELHPEDVAGTASPERTADAKEER